LIALTEYPAIDLRFQPGSDGARIEAVLYAALDDFQPLAIQEHESGDGWLVFFRDAVHRDRAAAALRRLEIHPSLDLTPLDVPDEDWARRSQANLTAIRIGRVTVAPPWDVSDVASRLSDPGSRITEPVPDHQGHGSRIPDPVTDHIVIVIDPSMGFGTGHHQTTRLCLSLLQSLEISGRRLIDVGTGSGVLAIAAAKLGARSVTAMDNDPDALQNARENVERNAVSVEIVRAELTAFTAAPADVVVANLTAAVLRQHASTLRRLAAPHGVLIVSGFSPEELTDVMASFDAREVRTAAEAEWAAAMLRV
jgi:ribosomal protein L11 methyltransferase